MSNLDKMDKFFEHQLSYLCQEKIGSWNSPASIERVEFIIINLFTKKSPGLDMFTGDFYKMKEEITPVPYTLRK